MSKYIKLEDIEMLINACEWRMTLAKERHGMGFVDYSKQVLDVDELTKRLSDLPTIEVSDDCISRKALLDQIYEDSKDQEGFYGDEWEFIDTINNVPSVVPKQKTEPPMPSVKPSRAEGKWVPVSERLPEPGVKVMCCDDSEDIYFGYHDFTGWYWEAEACAAYWAKDDNVIAWMPLPEPYKDGDTEWNNAQNAEDI